MLRTLATNHVDKVADNFLCPEKRAVHPASSLLHQRHHVSRSISKGFCIGNISQIKSLMHLRVDLQTHDPVFCQVLVGLSTSWGFSSSYISEELIEGLSLDRLPAEDRIGTRQHLCEAKKGLTCFVWRVTHFILKELSSLNDVGTHAFIATSRLTCTLT